MSGDQADSIISRHGQQFLVTWCARYGDLAAGWIVEEWNAEDTCWDWVSGPWPRKRDAFDAADRFAAERSPVTPYSDPPSKPLSPGADGAT